MWSSEIRGWECRHVRGDCQSIHVGDDDDDDDGDDDDDDLAL